MRDPVRVTMLGGFSIEPSPGVPAGPWPRPTSRRLLELLCLRPGHRLRREELAEILFPNLSPPRSANGVSKALTLARATLRAASPGGVSLLGADRESVWIRPEVRLDIDLEGLEARLRAALEMPRASDREMALAEALATDVPLLPDEIYSDWVKSPRDGLEELRQQARFELAQARSAGHQPAELPLQAVEAWKAVVAGDPGSEEATSALMRYYAATGRRDLALRAFHRCRAALSDLGVEVSSSLEEVRREIGSAPPVPLRDPVARAPASPPTHGRGRLTSDILRSLSRARMGRAPAIFLSGPAGIGKTHVLEVVCWELESRGWQAARGTVYPGEARVPLAALRRLLAGVEAPPPDAPLLRRLLDRPGGGAVEPPAHGGKAGVQLVWELGRWLDEVARERPLGLVLDDFHWADPSLALLLQRLADRPGQRRWALLLAARSDEPQAAVPTPSPAFDWMQLVPLRPVATAAVVRQVVPAATRLPRSEIARVVQRSGGNPFFAVELARQALTAGQTSLAQQRGTVPARIVALLQGRLQRVSMASRRILPLVVIAGEDASWELLLRAGESAIGEGAAESTSRALEELLECGLLREAGDGVQLVHPLLGEAALANTNALRRSALHSRVADELEQMEMADAALRLDSIARHRLAAFESGRLRDRAPAAAAAAFAAGHRARALFAIDAAIELFRAGQAAFKALTTQDRRQLRPAAVAAVVALGDTLLDRGDVAEAEAAYRRVLLLAETSEEVGRIWSALGGIAYRHGDLEGAVSGYLAGLTALRADAPLARARLQSDLGWARHRQGKVHEALELLQGAASILERSADPVEAAVSLDRLSLALMAMGRMEEALVASDRAFAVARGAGAKRELASLHIHRSNLEVRRGLLEDALGHARAGGEISAAAGDIYMQSVAHWATADVLDRLGDPLSALRERDAEVAILEAVDNQRNLAGAQAHRSCLLRALGDHLGSQDAADRAVAAATAAGDQELATAVLETLATRLP